MKNRSLSIKFQAPKPKEAEKKRLTFIKEKLKGFHVKKVFTYGDLIEQKILLSIDIQEKDNLTFEVVYYPNSQTFLIEPLNNGSPVQKDTIIATLNELVEFKKSGIEEVTIEVQGKVFCAFHCANFCVFLRDCFLGVICPKCNIKFNPKCSNCGGKGLIPQDMQPCFKCKATGIYPKGSKTNCNLCKSKGYIDPTWNICTACQGLGAKKDSNTGGSFVYPCSSCNSLGFRIGKKVDSETTSRLLRSGTVMKKEEKKQEVTIENSIPQEKKEVVGINEIPIQNKEEKVEVKVETSLQIEPIVPPIDQPVEKKFNTKYETTKRENETHIVCVKGLHIKHVAPNVYSLNEECAFIIYTDEQKNIYIWFGKTFPNEEKQNVELITETIKTNLMKDSFEVVDPTQENEAFWGLLGGKKDIKENDDSKEEKLEIPQGLFETKFVDGKLFFEKDQEIPICNNLSQDQIYILDVGKEIFVWTGKWDEEEKTKAGLFGVEYLYSSKRGIWIPIKVVEEGNEEIKKYMK